MEKKRFLLTVYCVSDSSHVAMKNKKIEMEQVTSYNLHDLYDYINGFDLTYIYKYTIFDFYKNRCIDSYENFNLSLL